MQVTDALREHREAMLLLYRLDAEARWAGRPWTYDREIREKWRMIERMEEWASLRGDAGAGTQ